MNWAKVIAARPGKRTKREISVPTGLIPSDPAAILRRGGRTLNLDEEKSHEEDPGVVAAASRLRARACAGDVVQGSASRTAWRVGELQKVLVAQIDAPYLWFEGRQTRPAATALQVGCSSVARPCWAARCSCRSSRRLLLPSQ